jgi:hypothetical protein
VAPGSLAVPGLAFCARCLEGERTEGDPVWARPPRAVIVKLLRPAIALAAIGFTAGAAIGWQEKGVAIVARTVGAPSASQGLVVLTYVLLALLLFLCGLLGAIAGGSVGMLVCYALPFFDPRSEHPDVAAWQRDLKKRFGLERLPDTDVAIVLHFSRRPRFGQFTLPAEYGLLVEGEGGFAFFGAKGSRTVFPLAQIRGASLERLFAVLPPRSYLRLELAPGSERFFAFVLAPSWRRCLARAREVQGRVVARLARANA